MRIFLARADRRPSRRKCRRVTPADASDPSALRLTMIVLLKRVAAAPRWLIYACCSLLVVLTSYHLGKAMTWDTMGYHVYAGFSALHDRFGQDYFAAGPQAYFNPYAYIPFYLLIRSSLTPLEDASILALIQSGILWLTYELTVQMVYSDTPKVRTIVGVLAALFAFLNPVLINEFGSSYADVTTAEFVLMGWLLLVTVVRTPSAARVIGAALLLGVASGLKLTNTVHAVAAASLLLFIPESFVKKLRISALYVLMVSAGFILVSLPWSIHLERHFGNPVFPLLNGLFRSPQYTTGTMLDHRFMPATLGAALARPFEMVLPKPWIHFELSAPDLRYALLLMLLMWFVLRWLWRRVSESRALPKLNYPDRVLAAVTFAFLVDWVLWLSVSGNSRYFIPMACVAAALCFILIFRLLSAYPAIRNCLLAMIFIVQFVQLGMGADYRYYLPWHHGSWFTVSVPSQLKSSADLYFLIGGQTNSYIIPDMPRDSGFVNLGGFYQLSANGVNGEHIKALIRRFAPHLRAIWSDESAGATQQQESSRVFESANDALEPFGLRVDAGRCAMIVVHGVHTVFRVETSARQGKPSATRDPDTKYLVTCHVVRNPSAVAPLPGERTADVAFDHLEDACPALFQPRRPVDVLIGDARSGYIFLRKYTGSAVHAWIAQGIVRFQKVAPGGREEDAGSERMWVQSPPRVACGWQGAGFIKVVPQ